MELNNENYHSSESSLEWMGNSQFGDFMKCEYGAMQKILHKEENKSEALLCGSYYDAYFSEELSEFTKNHPELFTKQGTLKATYQSAERAIECTKNDEMLMKYAGGEHQVIKTGVIAGVPFKIKMDAYHPDKCIVDWKLMKDLNPVWVNENGKNVKKNFVEAYNYDFEGAIYQEIESQNSENHKKLPFILSVVTKEEVPSKGLFSIDQEDMDRALSIVKENAPRFYDIKKGLIEPRKCGKCEWCRKTMKVTGIRSYHVLDENYEEGEE